jgi:hypothetical protein
MKRSLHSAFSLAWSFAFGLAVLLAASQVSAQVNLNGEWRSDSGGIYDIRQRGDHVIWEAHAPDYRWTHRFEGNIRGDLLRGFFADHPPGQYHNGGPLEFQISGNTLYRVNRTRAFTDTQLNYIGAVPQSAYAQNQPRQDAQADAPAAEAASPEAVRALDAFVTADSKSWVRNRYDYGSIYDASVEQRSADNSQVTFFARYTYNGGRRGWVRVKTTDGHFSCMEFHDFAGTCRSLGASPSIGLVAAGAGLAALAIVAGSSHGSGGNSDTSGQRTDPYVGYKFSHDNAEHQANCPGTPGPCQ